MTVGTLVRRGSRTILAILLPRRPDAPDYRLTLSTIASHSIQVDRRATLGMLAGAAAHVPAANVRNTTATNCPRFPHSP